MTHGSMRDVNAEGSAIKVLFQSGRFITVGVASALVDLGLTWALLDRLVKYQVAVGIGFASGLAINYFLHSAYTFQSATKPSVSQVMRYLVTVSLNISITVGVVTVLHEGAGVAPFAAKIASLPFVFFCGFTLSRYWIFR